MAKAGHIKVLHDGGVTFAEQSADLAALAATHSSIPTRGTQCDRRIVKTVASMQLNQSKFCRLIVNEAIDLQ